MWAQVVGKVCLALTEPTNHFWNIAFQLTSRGLTTPALERGGRSCTATFDFLDHRLVFQCSDGAVGSVALEPKTVADFYREVMETLRRLDLAVRIWPMPVEVPDPIAFERDTVHHSYDPEAAGHFWQALVRMQPTFERFRGRFVGKCSPLHFFWGSFDVALTRFSGRKAPERPGADKITRESYSHEVISHGFWLGSGSVEEPAFYAYAAPEPEGLKQAVVAPSAAFYSADFSEFILPYEAVRTARSPSADLMAFLTSTYDAAADLAGWNRAELERR